MDYRKIIVIIITSLVLLSNCKPRPNLDIVVNASFKVTPNTKKIRLGDTLRLSLSAGANFPTSSGGTYLANDAKLSIPLDIAEIDLSGQYSSIVSMQNMFKVSAQRGVFEYNPGIFMFGKVMSNCINNEYNIDMFIIPQKKDTFYISLNRAVLFNNKYSVGALIDFNGNNQNLEILPSGTTGVSGNEQSTRTYAFIVE